MIHTRYVLASACLLASSASTQLDVSMLGAHEVERDATGNYLFTFGGFVNGGIVWYTDAQREPLWLWPRFTSQTHSAYATGRGNVLVTDWAADRVLELAPDGSILWNSDDVSPLSDGSRLYYPNDAQILASGNMLICDLNNHRVIEIDRLGNVLWQYGTTAVVAELKHPHAPKRLANGNTLICNSGADRVIEIDASGNVLWTYAGPPTSPLNFPRSVDTLPAPSDDILIGDMFPRRVLEVDKVTGLVNETPLGIKPYDVDLLPWGNYLVGSGHFEEVVPITGQVVWRFPNEHPFTTVTPQLTNPTSLVQLYSQVRVPSIASPTNKRPAIVLVPPTDRGESYMSGPAKFFAEEGFIVATFDPDGRGRSTNQGTYLVDDYGGYIHQDSLHEVLNYVAGRNDVNVDRIIVASYGYGNTMAAGCLSRYPNDPPVALFRDWEGPADRTETALANGGFVPWDPLDDTYWKEREALRFMGFVQTPYIREQTLVDHDPLQHPTNFHAIALNRAATHTAFGGFGMSPYTQLNHRSHGNEQDTVWLTGLNPPRYVDESLDNTVWDSLFVLLEAEDIFRMPSVTVSGSVAPGGSAVIDTNGSSEYQGRPYALSLSAGADHVTSPASIEFWFGFLDTTGKDQIVLPIPNLPALSGTRWFVQGTTLIVEEPRPFRESPYAIVDVL